MLYSVPSTTIYPLIAIGGGEMLDCTKLEEKLAEWTGMYSPNQVVVCSSGTAALHLALEAMELPQESTVVVPEFTMVACARAVTLSNLIPRFVDCGNDLLMQAHSLDLRDASAVMPVHIYGRHLDVARLHRLKPPDCKVVEDMAEIHGINPHPKTDAACWSFYINKVIHGEEGGAVAFKDPHHATIARELRCQGFSIPHNFIHRPRGCNYRLADCLARQIIQSLGQYTINLERRKRVEKWYNENLPSDLHMPPRHIPWVYDLRIPDMSVEQQTDLVNRLAWQRARYGFRPMSEQPEYFNPKHVRLNAHRLSREIIYLPISPSATKSDVAATCKELLLAL